MAIKARKNQDLADDSKLYRATDAAAAPGIGKATKQLPQNWDDSIDATVGTTPAVLPKKDVPDLNKTPFQAALAGAQPGGAGAGIGTGAGAGPGMSAAPQTAVTPATPAAEEVNTGWGVSDTPFRAAAWSYGSAPRYRMSEWDRRMRSALGRAENMEFSYDRDTDPVWRAYLDQYTREGRRAMEDTLGRVSAQTGGLASSYGVSAAAQQRNDYAQRLTDKIPELYQQAYQRYLQEYQRQMGLADTYRGLEDRNYSRWSNDTLGQYNTDRNLSYQQWRDETGDARTAEDTAYEREQDAYERQLAMAKLAAQYGDYSGLRDMGVAIPDAQPTVYSRAVGGRGNSGGSGTEETAAEAADPLASVRTRPDYLGLVNSAVQSSGNRDKAIADLARQGVTAEEIMASGQLEPGPGSTTGKTAKTEAPAKNSASTSGISTLEDAVAYLAARGITARDYQIPSEAAFKRGKNDPDSDAYGYASYAEFLRDYVAYILYEQGVK